MWFLTPEHSRAARHLLGWTVTDLAKGAGVSKQTVGRFERDDPGAELKVGTLRKMVVALESAGIVFMKGVDTQPSINCSDGTRITLDPDKRSALAVDGNKNAEDRT